MKKQNKIMLSYVFILIIFMLSLIVYEGKNYAECYFGIGKLNKIEEFSFNALIHNAGLKRKK